MSRPPDIEDDDEIEEQTQEYDDEQEEVEEVDEEIDDNIPSIDWTDEQVRRHRTYGLSGGPVPSERERHRSHLDVARRLLETRRVYDDGDADEGN